MPEPVHDLGPGGEEIVVGAGDSGCREGDGPSPRGLGEDAEYQDQHHRQPEGGDRVEDQSHDAEQGVGDGVLPNRLHHPQEDPHREGEDQGTSGEHKGVREMSGQKSPHRLMLDKGGLEVALKEGSQPLQVPDGKRLIQPKIPPDLLQDFRRHVGAEVEMGGIARSQAQDDEEDRQDPQNEGNGRQKASKGVTGHRARTAPVTERHPRRRASEAPEESTTP